MTFRMDQEEFELQRGDSLHFRASIPHAWYNRGDTTARFSVTATMPVLFRSLMQTQIASAGREAKQSEPTRISLVG